MMKQQIKSDSLIFSCHCHYLYHQLDRNNRSICLSKYHKTYSMYLNICYNSKRHSHEQTLFSLTSILNEYVVNIDEHFLYILSTVNNEKQLKYWTKIQRLLKTKRNRLKVKIIFEINLRFDLLSFRCLQLKRKKKYGSMVH